MRELEPLPYKDMLRKLGLLSLEKARLCGDLTTTSQSMKGPSGELERDSVRNCSDGTRTNGYRLKEGKFKLDLRKKFFTMRAVRHWNRFSKEILDVATLAVFQARLDKTLSSLG